MAEDFYISEELIKRAIKTIDHRYVHVKKRISVTSEGCIGGGYEVTRIALPDRYSIKTYDQFPEDLNLSDSQIVYTDLKYTYK